MVTLRESDYIRAWDDAVNDWMAWNLVKGSPKSPMARVVYARYRASLNRFATAATKLYNKYPHGHVGPARVANGE